MDTNQFFRHVGRLVEWGSRAFAVVGAAVFALVLANTVLHAYAHVCPIHVAHLDQHSIVPVVYGRPTPDALYQAARGKIQLGGCVVGPVAGVCPWCGWPAAFARGGSNRVARPRSPHPSNSATRSVPASTQLSANHMP